MLIKENLLAEMKVAESLHNQRYNVLPWCKGCKSLAKPSAVQFFVSTNTEYLLSMIFYSVRKFDIKFYSIKIKQRWKTTTIQIFNGRCERILCHKITNITTIPTGEYWFDIIPIKHRPGYTLLTYRWNEQ